MNRLGDYYQRAIDGMIVLTKFLDLEEINQIKTLEKDGLKVYFYGGYNDAERVRAIIQYRDYEEPSDDDFKISVYHTTFNKTYKDIGHRNVLGSIMSLGIERNTFGDIYIVDNNIYLFVSCEIEKYLIDNMPLINNQSLEFIKTDNINDGHVKEEEIRIINVASMRLDAIIARSLNVSRSKATEIIESGLVFINHVEVNSITHTCKLNEIISIRKFGRITILENLKKTKKDRLQIKIGVKH